MTIEVPASKSTGSKQVSSEISRNGPGDSQSSTSAQFNVDFTKLGLIMGRGDVSTDDVDELISFAKKCPLFVNASQTVGDLNVSLFFVGDDIQVFHYILDKHVRKLNGVKNTSFTPILSWVRGFVAPFQIDVRKSKGPPCGMLPYCPKCPANPKGTSSIWAQLAAQSNGKGNGKSKKYKQRQKTSC